MTIKIPSVISVLIGMFICFNIFAADDESAMIKADRQALAEANTTGISSKIIAAKEQLSDDLGMEADQKR